MQRNQKQSSNIRIMCRPIVLCEEYIRYSNVNLFYFVNNTYFILNVGPYSKLSILLSVENAKMLYALVVSRVDFSDSVL